MKFKDIVNNGIAVKEPHKVNYEWKIVWGNVIKLTYIHLAALYGLYLAFCYGNLWSFIWHFSFDAVSKIGITAGAHRLWCHRSYKAKWPMRLILIIFQTVAVQGSVYQWVRDHRMHHKFTDTDADPYNARRGFFFSHIGWLILREHPDVIRKNATIDMSDLERDSLVVFQKKWYPYMALFLSFIVPTIVPWWKWDENLWYAWHYTIVRYCIDLNIAWLVNSAAHIWGVKLFDRSITPTDNASVSFLTFGEGWHNYHHVFPWDYKAAELGNYWLNFTTAFIDLLSRFSLQFKNCIC